MLTTRKFSQRLAQDSRKRNVPVFQHACIYINIYIYIYKSVWARDEDIEIFLRSRRSVKLARESGATIIRDRIWRLGSITQQRWRWKGLQVECGRRETLPWETTERLLHRLLPTTSTRARMYTYIYALYIRIHREPCRFVFAIEFFLPFHRTSIVLPSYFLSLSSDGRGGG